MIRIRNLLPELADGVDPQKIYEKSDLLQTLRILKNYDLIKDSQMELFRVKRRSKDA